MSKQNLFLSWLAVKAVVVAGLLFILLGCNYIFSSVMSNPGAFWYDVKMDTEATRRAVNGIGNNIDRFDQWGYTALMAAASAGKVDAVELMIKAGADVNLNANNINGDSPLHCACRVVNLNVMDFLLKNNASPILNNKEKILPFTFIVDAVTQEDFKRAINMFLTKGFDINYQDEYGRSLLFWVIDNTQTKHLNILQTDFKHLVDFDIKDKKGKTIRQYAAAKGDIQESINPPLFLEPSPSTGVNLYEPRYSLNENFTYTMVSTIKGRDRYLIDAIKKYKADVNLADKTFGNTCLHWACLYNRLKCLDIVLNSKANVNIKNKAGMSPIHCLWGIRNSIDRVAAAKLLSDFGTNFNAQNDDGNTFLHNAVLWADVDFVKLIATNDSFVHVVNFNLKNKENKTAFDLSQRFKYDSKYIEIADLLRNYNNISYVGEKDKQAGITALMLACMRGDLIAAKVLISEVKDAVNKKDKNGDTPLHFAIRFRNIDIAKMLIVAGAKVNEKNNLGDTPLNEVVSIFDKNQREEIVKLLLEKGSGISENKNGENIMHLAVRKNMPELILFLKQNFGKSAKNKDGKTAYDLAKEIEKKGIEMKDVINALDGLAIKK